MFNLNISLWHVSYKILKIRFYKSFRSLNVFFYLRQKLVKKLHRFLCHLFLYFRQTGAYAQILWRILAHDFIQFTIVFLVILLAFSGSFILSLKGEHSIELHSETR